MKSIDLFSLSSVAGRVYIRQCEQLQSLAIPLLTTVGGNLELELRQAKVVLLPALRAIAGQANIRENYQMQSLDLSKLAEIKKDCYLRENNQLAEISLPSLISVNGQLEINYNRQITRIVTAKLTKISNNLQVEANRRLRVISMPELVSIDSYVDIRNNPELSALKDFGKLRTVARDFRIQGNTKLQCVRGFSGITKIGGRLCLEQNSKLFMCDQVRPVSPELAHRCCARWCASWTVAPRNHHSPLDLEAAPCFVACLQCDVDLLARARARVHGGGSFSHSPVV